MTIFQKIIDKEIPADIVFEDEQMLAFKDVNPQAPTHLLLIPKKPISAMTEVKKEDSDLLGKMMVKASEIAKDVGLAESGYRIIINSGSHGGQTVFHLHIHIMGGRPMRWPPG